MSKRIVTVFGATGRQGGGAVEYLCEDGTFHVRAVTRNPDSDAAKALAAKGAELVKADLNDKESLVKAMKGAYGVFGVTDYWTANGQEETHGKNLVDAAKETGIQHFVYSTALSTGEMKLDHGITKNNVDAYLIASGVPRTSLYTAWFWENIGSQFFNLTKDKDGSLLLDLDMATDGPLVAVSGKDCGVAAAIALKNPDKYIGKDIWPPMEHTSLRKIHPVLEEIVGEKIKLKEMTMDEYDQAKDRMWPELWLNYKAIYEYHDKFGPDGSSILVPLPKVRSLNDCIREKGGKEAILPK